MATSSSDYLLLARLIRPQGRHGELLAEILTDFPARFSDRRNLVLLPAGGARASTTSGCRPVVVENHWLHKGRLVLKFAGVDSISEAETLRGMEVAIPVAERTPLPDDSVYISDLIGCRLIDEAAEPAADLGEIIDVQREALAADLLIVRRSATREEVLVPFARSYLVAIDFASKQVRMRLPEGLAAINAPLTPEERALQSRAAGAE